MSEQAVTPPAIESARPEDFDEIAALIDLGNQVALADGGEIQWQTMDHVYGQVRGHLENGEMFVTRDQDGAIISTIALQEHDSYMWGDERGNDGEALYFHKLMRHPVLGSRGAAGIMLQFAATEALSRGKSVLRCDVKSKYESLLKYYYGFGFQKVDDTFYKTTQKPSSLLEAPVQLILEA